VRRKLIILVVLAYSVAACQPTPVPPTPLPPTPVPATATPRPTATVGKAPNAFATGDLAVSGSLRFLLAIPDAPAVDIFVESTPVAVQVTYGQPSPARFLAPDTYHVYVVPAGKTPTDKILFQYTVKVTVGQALVQVFTGSPDNFALSQLLEDLSPVHSGQARVIIADYLIDGSGIAVASDNQPTYKLAGPGRTTTAAVLSAGDHTLHLAAGKQPVTLTALNAYLFVVLESKPLRVATIASPVMVGAQVRFVNLTGLQIDLFLDNGQMLAHAVAARSGSDWVPVLARPQSVRVYNSRMGSPALVATGSAGGGSQIPPLLEAPLRVAADSNLNIVLYGPTTALQVTTYIENLDPTPKGVARVVFMNMVPQSGTINVEPYLPDAQLAFGTTSALTDVAPDIVQQLAFRLTDKGSLAELDPDVKFVEGTAYLVVATGGSKTQQPPVIVATTVGVGQPTPTPAPGG